MAAKRNLMKIVFMATDRPVCLLYGTRAQAVAVNYATKAYSSTAAQPVSLLTRRPDRAANKRLPDKPARTRFAPSPTGYLHLGSLRTALYNYLLARATNGQFILRLEDTDQSRIVPDAESRLYDDLKWSGLLWDEGPDCGGPYGPYKQSERLDIYQRHADRLLQEGKAFRCFCSQDDMAAHHQKTLEADGAVGTYPGLCLSIPAEESAERAARGEAHTVRFRSSATPASVHDIVYGLYKKRLPEDHFIIMKSDGFPTYHFANVVDDHLMAITHVVRGAVWLSSSENWPTEKFDREWLISTAKHVSLYDALGWEPPRFAHVGLLVDSNRQKLSKRNMDIGIDSYMRDGIPPGALLNFSALLGWSPTNSSNKGVMSLDDMVRNFGLKFTKGDIIVNAEKLGFFHKRHIQLALSQPSPENNRTVDQYITEPVLQLVRETEIKRQGLAANVSQQDSADENSVSWLGQLILPLFSDESHTDNRHTYDRIRAAIRISRNEAVTPSSFAEAIRYLVWQPPAAYLEKTYRSLLPPSASSFVEGKLSPAAGVMRYFADRLDKIDDREWAVDTIQAALDDTVKHVTYCEAEGSPVTAGYKFLRWSLLGLNSGPQISHLMDYLGKTETSRRLQLAETVAESLAESTPAD